jgi:hypothetical protein
MTGENICGSDILVWGPAAEGEKTSLGRRLPAGWVWTCGCGAYGAGHATETDADAAADNHPASNRYHRLKIVRPEGTR